MTFSPYLYFNGDCGEAFDFYKSVFGGEIPVRATYADAPPDMNVADADKGKIMHVSLAANDSVLMGSDVLKGMGEPPKGPSNAFSLSYSPKTKAEADAIFEKLSEGGATTMAMHDAFWGAYFGMCRDKFGVHWMINVGQG